MKAFVQVLMFCCMACSGLVAVAQKKYKFEYTIRLENQASSFEVYQRDSALNDMCLLQFSLFDYQNGELIFAHIKLKNDELDTLLFTNLEGKAMMLLPEGKLSADQFYVGFSPLHIDSLALKPNTILEVKSKLGLSYEPNIGHIYSKRKLSKLEIQEITQAVSQGRTNHPLIENKTCTISFEI